jgi:16S rRNA (guanine527-N7)-methyltransferase
VIAVRCPSLHLTLVERRATRADLLRRAVAALNLFDRVRIVADDVRMVAAQLPQSFDVVTARSFAAPPITAKWASALLTPGGLLIVSEPPDDDPSRWPASMLGQLGLRDLGRDPGPDQGVRTFLRC